MVQLVIALYFYKERFILDGTCVLYEITENNIFISTGFRFIMWLQQILPAIAVNVGLSLKAVMVSYVINDALYYIVIYLYAWFRFRSNVLLLSIIFLHLLTIPNNFYLMVEELLPGAVLIPIIIWAIQPSETKKLVKFWEIFLLITLAAFSHPLIGGSLLMVLFFITIKRQWYLIPDFFKRKRTKDVIYALIFLFGIRYTLTFIGYEKEIIDAHDNSYFETIGLIVASPSIVFNLLKYYLTPNPATTIIIIATIIGLIHFKRYLSLGILLFFSGLYVLLLATYINFAEWGLWLVDDVRADRWSSPVRILFIIAFGEVLLNVINLKKRISILYPAMGVIVLIGFIGLIRPTIKATNTIEYYEKIIAQVKQINSGKKFYYNAENVPLDTYIMDNNYLPTLIYSSINGADETVHAIAVRPEDYPEIEKLSGNFVCTGKGDIKTLQQLNKNYYGLNKEVYKYLDVQ